MESRTITITPAAHKYGNLNIYQCGLDFFPPDVFGGPSRKTGLGTQQKRNRFDLLRKAYVGARYDTSYKITAEELKYLARCVELLREQTETSCEKKMESFV